MANSVAQAVARGSCLADGLASSSCALHRVGRALLRWDQLGQLGRQLYLEPRAPRRAQFSPDDSVGLSVADASLTGSSASVARPLPELLMPRMAAAAQPSTTDANTCAWLSASSSSMHAPTPMHACGAAPLYGLPGSGARLAPMQPETSTSYSSNVIGMWRGTAHTQHQHHQQQQQPAGDVHGRNGPAHVLRPNKLRRCRSAAASTHYCVVHDVHGAVAIRTALRSRSSYMQQLPSGARHIALKASAMHGCAQTRSASSSSSSSSRCGGSAHRPSRSISSGTAARGGSGLSSGAAGLAAPGPATGEETAGVVTLPAPPISRALSVQDILSRGSQELKLEAVLVQARGPTIETAQAVGASTLGLHPRDLSLFASDSRLSPQRATITVRGDRILFRTEAIKAVIERNKVWLIKNKRDRNFHNYLKPLAEVLDTRGATPFELSALEVLLHLTLMYFERRKTQIQWMTDRLLGVDGGSGPSVVTMAGENGRLIDAFGNISEGIVQQLAPLEKVLLQVCNDAKETSAELTKFLEEDDELNRLILSEVPSAKVLLPNAPITGLDIMSSDYATSDSYRVPKAPAGAAAAARYQPSTSTPVRSPPSNPGAAAGPPAGGRQGQGQGDRRYAAGGGGGSGTGTDIPEYGPPMGCYRSNDSAWSGPGGSSRSSRELRDSSMYNGDDYCDATAAAVAGVASASKSHDGGNFHGVTPQVIGGREAGYMRADMRKKAREEAFRILETYARELDSIAGTLMELEDQLQGTRESYRMQLDSARNHIILVNLYISIVSISVTIATLMPTFFGMNIVTGLEESHVAVFIIGFLSLAVAVASYPLILKYFKHQYFRQTRREQANFNVLRLFISQNSDDLESILEALRAVALGGRSSGMPLKRDQFEAELRARLPEVVKSNLRPDQVDYLFSHFDRDQDGVITELEANLESNKSYGERG